MEGVNKALTILGKAEHAATSCKLTARNLHGPRWPASRSLICLRRTPTGARHRSIQAEC